MACDGTIALLTRHVGAIPFAEMISHTFRIADAAKVLISNTLAPA